MHVKLSCYQLKIDCYNKFKMFYKSLMVTTKKKLIVDTQKIKKSKHTTTENHQITKKESKRGKMQL